MLRAFGRSVIAPWCRSCSLEGPQGRFLVAKREKSNTPVFGSVVIFAIHLGKPPGAELEHVRASGQEASALTWRPPPDVAQTRAPIRAPSHAPSHALTPTRRRL